MWDSVLSDAWIFLVSIPYMEKDLSQEIGGLVAYILRPR